MKKVIILGGGFAGCTAAYLLKRKNFDVTLIEANENPGGGVWTNYYAGHPYTFGPRIFFTKKDEIINQLTSLVEMREFNTISMSFVEEDSKLYNYPIQFDDINKMPDSADVKSQLESIKLKNISTNDFEDYWKSAIGKNLYQKFVNSYSKKMWGIESNKQLIANFEWVNRGTPIRKGDTRLYEDQYQGYPKSLDGYNSYFEKCLIDIQFINNTRVVNFDFNNNLVNLSNNVSLSADIIINTIHVDTLFDYTYGKLKYCGRNFLPIWLPIEFAMPKELTWIHYTGVEPHTRVTEFKKITNYVSNSTLLGIEIPSSNGRFYPVQSKPEIERFNQYKKLFPKNFFSIGRMGKFVYQGIPEAIEDAIEVSNLL
tara:strand:- start:887 stop:1993 length:1107 start_codon:yes stop_codon:yes gene_type:complete